MDYNLLTNSELKEKLQEHNEEFEKCKTIIQENYQKMVLHSEEYDKIKKLLNKREGKNDKK